MIKELTESLKFVGHYFAICFLRIYTGIYIFNLGLAKYSTNYLEEPLLAAKINEFLKPEITPSFLNYFFSEWVLSSWSFFAAIQVYIEIIFGLLLIVGFLTRPAVFVLIIYFVAFSFIESQVLWPWYGFFNITLFAIGWAGAGRCLGLDYYFYKRYRGFLW